MINIIIKTNSVSLNNTFEANKGMFSIRREGDIFFIGSALSSELSAYFTNITNDGAHFDSADELESWLSDNLFYNGGGSGEGLQKATIDEVQAGDNDSAYVTPKVVNNYIDWRVTNLLREDPTNVPLSLSDLNNSYPDAQLRTVID